MQLEGMVAMLTGLPILPAIAEYAIFCISLLVFLQERRKGFANALLFLLVGVSFLLVGVANSLAALGMDAGVLPQVYAAQSFAWVFIFSILVARLMRVKRLAFVMAVLLVSSVSLLFTSGYSGFSIMVPISYYAAGMAFFIIYDSYSEKLAGGGMLGIIGCFSAVTALAIGVYYLYPAKAAVDFIFMASFAYFLRFGLVHGELTLPSKIELVEEESGGSIIRPFVYIFLYVLLLNIAVFLASVGMHEGGHLVAGGVLGCEGGKIVLMDMFSTSMPGPYTEMVCPAGASPIVLGMSGFLLIVPFSILFLLLGRFPEKNLFYVILGFGVVMAGLDLVLVLRSEIAVYASLLAGSVLICIGEVFMVNDYVGIAKKMDSLSLITSSSQARGDAARFFS